jgi:hypothetical protein
MGNLGVVERTEETFFPYLRETPSTQTFNQDGRLALIFYNNLVKKVKVINQFLCSCRGFKKNVCNRRSDVSSFFHRKRDSKA